MRVVVIGGGIAGVSAGWELAHRGADVLVVEAEPTLAHHTTGRSAAQLIENYGSGPVRPLTHASLGFLHSPPDGLVDHPLLEQRGALHVANDSQSAIVDQLFADAAEHNIEQHELSAVDAVAIVPWLRGELIDRAVWEPQSQNIDVGALHQAFVRGLRAEGAQVERTARVTNIGQQNGGWVVQGEGFSHTADIVVNAAGAWGDEVATLAGVAPVGLEPRRRTAFMVASPQVPERPWPLTADVEHSWYVKPDGAQLMCSPADETLSPACDAKPEEIDIARTIDNINAATTLNIRSVRTPWAGLRTFSPDRSMVIGPDPDMPSFVWLVGQGGTGIQTAPGAARLVADLVFDGEPAREFDQHDLDISQLLPDRYR